MAAIKHPAATKNDHYDFCDIEGWEIVRGAKGKPVRHHITFKLMLDSGVVLRTRVSRPIDNKPYGTSMFKHILRDQLQVTADTFWLCVTDKKLPDRDRKRRDIPETALPLGIALELRRLGIKEHEISKLDAPAAGKLLIELYADQSD